MTIRFSKPVDAADLARLGTVVSPDAAQAVLSVPAAQASAVVRDALATLPIVDLAIEEPPLEEVMRELFRTGGRETQSAPRRERSGRHQPPGAFGAAPAIGLGTLAVTPRAPSRPCCGSASPRWSPTGPSSWSGS